MMPDYSLYPELTKDTAYGFLTRGCPRGCDFCIVKDKEGKKSIKVADLDEFYTGQKNIELCDPNFFACKDWESLSDQLIQSKSYIDFNQGIDIRIMSDQMIEALSKMKIKRIHAAWDRMKDEKKVLENLKHFKEATGYSHEKVVVYCLTNYDTDHEQDLYRVMKLRELGCDPYIMIYEKDKLPTWHITRKLQRYVNNRILFGANNTFSQYLEGLKK